VEDLEIDERCEGARLTNMSATHKWELLRVR